MRDFATAPAIQLTDEITTHFQRAIISRCQLAARKIANRQRAKVIGQIGNHCRAGCFQALHRNRLAQLFAVILDRPHDFFAVMHRRHTVFINDHCLNFLRPHDRANTAARGQP